MESTVDIWDRVWIMYIDVIIIIRMYRHTVYNICIYICVYIHTIFKVIILISAPTKLHKDFGANIWSQVLVQKESSAEYMLHLGTNW